MIMNYRLKGQKQVYLYIKEPTSKRLNVKSIIYYS